MRFPKNTRLIPKIADGDKIILINEDGNIDDKNLDESILSASMEKRTPETKKSGIIKGLASENLHP